MESTTDDNRIPVGISRCLLGEEVRYNGGHKLSRFCRDQLSKWFRYVDTCPEVEIGLPIPRKAMRLVATDRGTRVLQIDDPSRDFTDALVQLADSKKDSLDQLCGFIFMQKSPSCGAFRMKVYHPNGHVDSTDGRGAFADQVIRRYPNMPVEEAGRLMDAPLRENFVTRVFVYQEWRELLAGEYRRGDVIDFHSRHKYLLMARSQRHYKLLGRLLARAGKLSLDTLVQRYETLMMDGMRRVAGRSGNTNALQHMQGYLKQVLSSEEKAELVQLIESYRKGEVPLIAPLTLMRHYARLAPDYYRKQKLLAPHPKELGLYNDV